MLRVAGFAWAQGQPLCNPIARIVNSIRRGMVPAPPQWIVADRCAQRQ